MRALGFQFRAGDAGVHFVATPLGTQLSIAKLYTWLARKSPKWRFLAGKIIERHEGVFFRKPCVCVKRLHRRKTSVVTHRIICYVILYYIIFYYILPRSRGPPGSRGGRWPTKTPPGTRVNVPACSGPTVPGRRRAQLGCHFERIADSPWVPACTAWMSNLTV